MDTFDFDRVWLIVIEGLLFHFRSYYLFVGSLSLLVVIVELVKYLLCGYSVAVQFCIVSSYILVSVFLYPVLLTSYHGLGILLLRIGRITESYKRKNVIGFE